MWNYIWPILMVIAANTFYNICAKSIPGDIGPLASLTITYLTAAALSFLLFTFTSDNKNIFMELQKANWTSFVLGGAIIGLEFGYIYVYRAGWKVSAGSLVANVGLACILLFVGFFFYKENITIKQIAGMCISILGILLMSK